MGSIAKATHGKVLATSFVDGKMISSFNKYGDNWNWKTGTPENDNPLFKICSHIG